MEIGEYFTWSINYFSLLLQMICIIAQKWMFQVNTRLHIWDGLDG